MGSQPYLPLYTGDWLKDPCLSFCAPATRGVWIDLLCAMHELGREGELRGTTEQIARLARCQPAELVAALTDLINNRTATIDSRNNTWVIVCRRMKKAAGISQVRREAGSKNGTKPKQTLDIEDEDVVDGFKDKGRALCLEVVVVFCKGIKLTRADAEWFWHKCEGNGWTNGGRPMKDWRQTLRSWKAGGYVPSIKNPERGRPPGARIEAAKRESKPGITVEEPEDPIKRENFRKQLADWKASGCPLGEEVLTK
jgi:hypothetical protein